MPGACSVIPISFRFFFTCSGSHFAYRSVCMSADKGVHVPYLQLVFIKKDSFCTEMLFQIFDFRILLPEKDACEVLCTIPTSDIITLTM